MVSYQKIFQKIRWELEATKRPDRSVLLRKVCDEETVWTVHCNLTQLMSGDLQSVISDVASISHVSSLRIIVLSLSFAMISSRNYGVYSREQRIYHSTAGCLCSRCTGSGVTVQAKTGKTVHYGRCENKPLHMGF